MIQTSDTPDKNGYFGEYGGAFIPPQLEAVMKKRAQHWQELAYPFGSEMAWDSTGQEEVYGWCKYFGYDDKADVSLNSILGYMPTVR